MDAPWQRHHRSFGAAGKESWRNGRTRAEACPEQCFNTSAKVEKAGGVRSRRRALEVLISEDHFVEVAGDCDLFVFEIPEPRFFVTDRVG